MYHCSLKKCCQCTREDFSSPSLITTVNKQTNKQRAHSLTTITNGIEINTVFVRQNIKDLQKLRQRKSTIFKGTVTGEKYCILSYEVMLQAWTIVYQLVVTFFISSVEELWSFLNGSLTILYKSCEHISWNLIRHARHFGMRHWASV